MKPRLIRNMTTCSMVAVMLSGCATIVRGSQQEITVTSVPSEAKCAVYRDGMKLAQIDSTPGTVKVSRKESDLWIGCIKDRYDFSRAQDGSDVNGWLFGNIAFGGVIGLAVDMATGAGRAYDSHINVVLQPLADGIALPSALPEQYPGPIPRISSSAAAPAKK